MAGDIKQRASEWRTKLANAGYYIAEQEALDLTIFMEERDQPLILEGPPGSGKTSLVYAVSRVLDDAPVIRLNCFKSIGSERVLYGWDERLQALRVEEHMRANNGVLQTDVSSIIYDHSCLTPGIFLRAFRSTHPHTLVLINEIDKVPADEEFEATLLEVIEEHMITVDECGETIVPTSDNPPHVFFTSNAGVRGSSTRESLSHPLLRRGVYIYLPEPDRERRYDIVCVKAPKLSRTVARECVLFLERAQTIGLQKPIANSEGMTWVKSLQHFMPFTHLSAELVELTLSKLAKSEEDKKRVRAKLPVIFEHVHREYQNWYPISDRRAA